MRYYSLRTYSEKLGTRQTGLFVASDDAVATAIANLILRNLEVSDNVIREALWRIDDETTGEETELTI